MCGKERSAAVGRFDDNAPGAQSGDDTVAGEVEVPVLLGLRVEFGDEGSAVFEDVSGNPGVLYGCHPREGIGQDGNGGDMGGKSGPMGCDIDSESQSADDAESGDSFGESFDQSVAHRLSVGCCASGSDHGQAVGFEDFGLSQQIEDGGIVRHFAQQGWIFGFGCCDDSDSVSLTVEDFPVCGGKSQFTEDIPGNFGSELGFFDEFVCGCREDAPRIAEYFEQMHGAFHADSGSHLEGNILDCHVHESKSGIKLAIFRGITSNSWENG